MPITLSAPLLPPPLQSPAHTGGVAALSANYRLGEAGLCRSCSEKEGEEGGRGVVLGEASLQTVSQVAGRGRCPAGAGLAPPSNYGPLDVSDGCWGLDKW